MDLVKLDKVGAERLARAIVENHDRLGTLTLGIARGPDWERLFVDIGGRRVASLETERRS